MAAAEQLEALIKLENDLKAQYEKKLTVEQYKIAAHIETQAKLQASIAKLTAEITSLKSSNATIKRLEQENRELKNRVENSKIESETQRAKAKSVLKDMITLKTEIKNLKQFDTKKLKKNLLETKKKLDDQRASNELLSKNIRKYKDENHTHLSAIEKLENELETPQGRRN